VVAVAALADVDAVAAACAACVVYTVVVAAAVVAAAVVAAAVAVIRSTMTPMILSSQLLSCINIELKISETLSCCLNPAL
jgi:hypothetical protein